MPRGFKNLTFLMVGEGYWGKGKTPDEAFEKMRTQGTPGKRIILYASNDPEIRLDSDGCIVFHPPLEYEMIHKTTKGWRTGEKIDA